MARSNRKCCTVSSDALPPPTSSKSEAASPPCACWRLPVSISVTANAVPGSPAPTQRSRTDSAILPAGTALALRPPLRRRSFVYRLYARGESRLRRDAHLPGNYSPLARRCLSPHPRRLSAVRLPARRVQHALLVAGNRPLDGPADQ